MELVNDMARYNSDAAGCCSALLQVRVNAKNQASSLPSSNFLISCSQFVAQVSHLEKLVVGILSDPDCSHGIGDFMRTSRVSQFVVASRTP